jgi:hypothetical protein
MSLGPINAIVAGDASPDMTNSALKLLSYKVMPSGDNVVLP